MQEIRKIALMAVGDDGWQGGIQYITNIMGALNAVASEKKDLEVHLFRHSMQNFGELSRFRNIDIKAHDLESELEPWSLTNRIKWYAERKLKSRVYPRLENYLIREQFDYVFPATLSSAGNKLNAGAWIADFQYRHFPEMADKKTNEAADRVISYIANYMPKIVLSSKFCEDDCHKFFPATRGRTHVMPFSVSLDRSILAFDDFAAIRTKYELPEKFLIVSNLFAPTKNHQTLFRALGILKTRGVTVPLLCTGNIVDYRNHSYANEILQMLTANRVRQQVYLLGLIPRIDQLALYRMAVAMVQPSLNEGWNTSVEEAKALGKPLLLSDIPVHLEQYPGNSLFFSATDPEDLAARIDEVWKTAAGLHFPDKEAEGNAFDRYQDDIRRFAGRFLEIARS